MWVEHINYNNYEYHYKDAMNLIRDWGAVYSTVQYIYKTKQRKRRAHIKDRSHSMGGAH